MSTLNALLSACQAGQELLLAGDGTITGRIDNR